MTTTEDKSTEDKSASDDSTYTSIGHLARELGVSSRTIRYYEELGILPVPPRSSGGTRKYPREYRFYIEGALALKDLGFSLEEVKLIGRLALQESMTSEEHQRALDVVYEKMATLEHRIAVLSRLRDVLYEREGTATTEPLITRLVGDPPTRRSTTSSR